MTGVDADAHVIESPLTWSHIPQEDQKYAPLLVTQAWGHEIKGNAGRQAMEYWVMDNRFHARDKNLGVDTSTESRELSDVNARIDHMDRLNIDVQILYPTVFLRPAVRRAETELALTKSYNRWVAGMCAQAPDRLRWVALPPVMSMDKARDELDWARDNGACGIFIRGLEWEKVISDSYFFPLYKIASDLDLPVCLHSGTNSVAQHDTAILDNGFNTFIMPGVSAFHSLLEKRIPDRFPDIRWGFVELGSQWLPFVLHNLRYTYMRRGERWPENILAENRFYVACTVHEDIPYILQHAGDDNLMIGTDYGHHDPATEIQTFNLLRQREDIPPEVIEKIANTNARALYGL